MSTSRYLRPRRRGSWGMSQSPPGLIASWVNFWFTPVDPVGLIALRVLACVLFLAWLLPFAGEPEAMFGLRRLVRRAGVPRHEARVPELPPHLFSYWSALYLCGSSAAALRLIYWLSVAVITLFALAWTRLTAVLTWVAVVSFTANPATAYDADPLLRLLAFYLMLGYLFLGQGSSGQSFAARLLGTKTTFLFGRATPSAAGDRRSLAANLALRLLQVHFAIAMLANGLAKLQIKEWWNGLSFWFYFHPPYHETFEEVKAVAPYADTYFWFYSLAAYAVLAWQIGFPAFAWSRLGRPILLGGGVLALVTTVFFLPLPLLGPVIFIGCLSYLTPTEWHRLGSLLARLPGISPMVEPLLPITGRNCRTQRQGRRQGFRAACEEPLMNTKRLLVFTLGMATVFASITCAPVGTPDNSPRKVGPDDFE